MQIDWFTLFAQIVNFLILLYLLKRFLFDRIVKAMKRREDKIGDRIREVKKQREEAEKKKQEYRERVDELKTKEDEQIKKAKEEAASRKKEIMQKAREEVEQARKEWYADLEREKKDFFQEFQKRSSNQVLSITEKVLSDLADEEMEKKIAEHFVKKLKEMDKDKKEELLNKIKDKQRSIAVQSHFELSQDSKKKISATLKKQISEEIEIDYDINTDLIAGIVLKFDGFQTGWNIRDYMEELEQSWSDLLVEKISQNK